MKAAWVAVAIAVALVLQTTLAHLAFRGAGAADFVLVVVVYVGLSSGPVMGLFAGTVGGLAQDALSSGVIGIGGLADTIVGFLVGLVGTQFIVTQPPTRLVVFFGATVLRAVVFMGLYVLLGLRQFPSPYAAVAIQGVGNAFVGVVAFEVVDVLPGYLERRRASRPRSSRRLR
ncbi:MAG TPA: rod shape-determining protein MreD [Vicinamibacterales bacterium]|nr:rod shape-determining protein MreD [Vicinamibacterales bacterium]